jgi:hypothetical protein
MSVLNQKQTSAAHKPMPLYPPKSDIHTRCRNVRSVRQAAKYTAANCDDFICEQMAASGAPGVINEIGDLGGRLRLNQVIIFCRTDRVQTGASPCCFVFFAFSFSPPSLSSSWHGQRTQLPKRSNTPAMPNPVQS